MNEDHLSEQEKKLFQTLEREANPPGHLEKNIITQLKAEGQIKNTKTMKPIFQWAASVAVAIVIFMAGIYFEKLNENDMVQIEPTKGYMLLLHEDQNFQPGDPMDMYNEYGSWMENTFSKGIKITGQELKNEAVLVDVEGKSEVLHDIEGERTTGYFILEAQSLEEAIEVAKENPHIKYGGKIEVKPYMVR